jgi:hypothetical protein
MRKEPGAEVVTSMVLAGRARKKGSNVSEQREGKRGVQARGINALFAVRPCFGKCYGATGLMGTALRKKGEGKIPVVWALRIPSPGKAAAGLVAATRQPETHWASY